MRLSDSVFQQQVTVALTRAAQDGSALGECCLWIAGNCPQVFLAAVDVLGGKWRNSELELLVGATMAVLDINIGVAINARARALEANENAPASRKKPVPPVFKPLDHQPWIPPSKSTHGPLRDLARANMTTLERVGGDWPQDYRKFLVEQFALKDKPLKDVSDIRSAAFSHGLFGVFEKPARLPAAVVAPSGSDRPATTAAENAAVGTW